MNSLSRVGSSVRKTCDVIGSPIDVLSWGDALTRISAWAEVRASRVVCICNAHSLVTAARSAEFRGVLSNADMTTSDGAPVAFMLRRLGFRSQQRINGPDLLWRWCGEQDGAVSVYLYGGTPGTLEGLQVRLLSTFPTLRIAGAYSPPFRSLSPDEEEEVVRRINASGAGIVWVSLGCPKQEVWMSNQRGRISAVMIGVGAAFDYHAGVIVRAPLWMQNAGLEWLFRLASEPRRLWKRYLVTNTLFVWYALRQLMRSG